jgi:hypothetical protein
MSAKRLQTYNRQVHGSLAKDLCPEEILVPNHTSHKTKTILGWKIHTPIEFWLFHNYYFDSTFATLHSKSFLKCLILPHLCLVSLFAVIFSTSWASCCRIWEVNNAHLKSAWEFGLPGVGGSRAPFLSPWTSANTSLTCGWKGAKVSEQ